MSKEAPLSARALGTVSLEEEASVIARLQGGDKQALAMLYGWYGDPLFRLVILPRMPQRESAEDILKEAFRLAMERIHQFKPGSTSIFGWLRRIATNLAIDAWRRQGRQTRLLEAVAKEPQGMVAESSAPDQRIERQETRKLIDMSLSTLNPRYARALQLRLLEERSREECAGLLQVSVPQFDVILHRACLAFRGAYPP